MCNNSCILSINSTLNQPLNGKDNQEMDYFLAELEKEINMVESAKIIKEFHDTQ